MASIQRYCVRAADIALVPAAQEEDDGDRGHDQPGGAEEPPVFVVQRVSERDRLGRGRDAEQDKHDGGDAARDGDEARRYAEEDAFLGFGVGHGVLGELLVHS